MLPGLRTIEQASFWSLSAHQFEIQATRSDWVAFSMLCMNNMMMCNNGSVNTYGYFMQTFYEEGVWLWKSGSEWPVSSVKGQTRLTRKENLGTEWTFSILPLRNFVCAHARGWGVACASPHICLSPALFFPFNFSVIMTDCCKSELPLCFRDLHILNWELKSIF